MLPACRPNFAEAANTKQKVEQAWSIEWGYILISSIGYFVLHVTSCNSECIAHVTNWPVWTASEMCGRWYYEQQVNLPDDTTLAARRLGEYKHEWATCKLPSAKKRAWLTQTCPSQTKQCTRNTHTIRVHTKCSRKAYYLAGSLGCNWFTVAQLMLGIEMK
jgi:hypothetical protein